MASTTPSPSTTLSPDRKRKASDDYIEWWLADQQTQMSFGEDPNFQSNPVGKDMLNPPFEAWTPTSSNVSTHSGEILRPMNASKGVKRVFYLESDSTSSTASSFTTSVIFKSNSPSKKRTGIQRHHRDAELPLTLTSSSATTPDKKLTSNIRITPCREKNHSGQSAGAPQGTETIVQGLKKFSIAKGKALSDDDGEVSVSSGKCSLVHEWPKEAPDPILSDVLVPRIGYKNGQAF
jgi:hypothetical protein